jgi:polyhydroxybutyrate depolymerase
MNWEYCPLMRRHVHPVLLGLVFLLGSVVAVVLTVALTGAPATPVIAVPHRPASHHPTLPLLLQSTDRSPPITEPHTVSIDGVARTYRSIVAARPAGQIPLLIVLHGRGQSESSMLSMTGFVGLVQQRQVALLLPEGEQRSWNAGHGCCGFAGAHEAPDVPFVAAMVADALRRWPIDAQRVYLVGYSNGGKLAYSTVCAHPALFAAVATYGAVPLSPCPPGTPAMSVLLAAGSEDQVLPFRGKPVGHPPLPSVAQALTWLRAQDGCSARAQTVRDGSAVVQLWAGCAGGTDVESVVYPGRGHAWPSGGSPTAATLMWTFLSRHAGHGAPSPR